MLTACSKNASDSIVGTWVFTNQFTASSYTDHTLSPLYPSTYSTMALSNDSIRIVFNGNGTFTFYNFHLPVDQGTYSIVRDSLLVIQPDTAGFVKFNYPQPAATFSTTTPPVVPPVIIPGDPSTYPVYAPYANFHFISDTIQFKITSGKVAFSTTWLSKQQPSGAVPTSDSLVINQCGNFFTRQ